MGKGGQVMLVNDWAWRHPPVEAGALAVRVTILVDVRVSI